MLTESWECDGIRDIKMIANRVRTDMIKEEDMMSVLDVQEMLGLPLLGVIPEDAEVLILSKDQKVILIPKDKKIITTDKDKKVYHIDEISQDIIKSDKKNVYFIINEIK